MTGAGRRVGQAIAIALAGWGARVVVHYNASGDGARETLAQIERAGGEGWLVQGDLSRPGEPARLIDDVVTRAGGLDILVNSAAIMLRTPLESVTESQWDEMFALNLRAPFFCAVAAGRAMTSRGGGAIINIADLAGLEAWPAYVPHGITKAGVIHMTESLARVLAPTVRVNAIAPGAVLLPEAFSSADAERLASTTPLGRIGSPDDVSRAVIYLLEADYVTGETLIVDGGRHVR